MGDFEKERIEKVWKCPENGDISNCPIRHHCTYSGFGWFLYSMGVSAQPVKIDFKCDKCGAIIESTTDKAIMKKFVGR